MARVWTSHSAGRASPSANSRRCLRTASALKRRSRRRNTYLTLLPPPKRSGITMATILASIIQPRPSLSESTASACPRPDCPSTTPACRCAPAVAGWSAPAGQEAPPSRPGVSWSSSTPQGSSARRTRRATSRRRKASWRRARTCSSSAASPRRKAARMVFQPPTSRLLLGLLGCRVVGIFGLAHVYGQ